MTTRKQYVQFDKDGKITSVITSSGDWVVVAHDVIEIDATAVVTKETHEIDVKHKKLKTKGG
jgi:hypothetical protein